MERGSELAEALVALQGTIDTFDLPEVIRMLAAGAKTGRLGLSGDRGEGSVWFDSGKVVASTTDATEVTGSHDDVVFQLLRFNEGSFVFDQGSTPSYIEEPTDAGTVLDAASERLGEWREIEAVVPSVRSMVILRTDLDRADVVIDRERWAALVAVGGGVMVEELADRLELDEMGTGRVVKELADLGLVEIGEELPEPLPSYLDGTMEADGQPNGEAQAEAVGAELEVTEPTFGSGAAPAAPFVGEAEPLIDETDTFGGEEPDRTARQQLDSLASGFGMDDGAGATGYDEREPFADPTSAPTEFAEPIPLDGVAEPIPTESAPVDSERDETTEAADPFPIEQAAATGQATTQLFSEPGASTSEEEPAQAPVRPEPGEAAEVARQLANLSPEAARAVAAAARATTDEERDAALAEVAQSSDQPIDPDLLRKFLSSVRH